MNPLGLIFDTAKGRAVAAIAAVLALFVWFASEQRNVGAQHAVQKINVQAKTKVDEARTARARVPDRGNAEWLLKHSCRDC